jgi:hypothetical protein
MNKPTSSPLKNGLEVPQELTALDRELAPDELHAFGEMIWDKTFSKRDFEIPAEEIPVAIGAARCFIQAANKAMKSKHTAEQQEQIGRFWLPITSDIIHRMNINFKEFRKPIPILTMLDLHVATLDNYAAGLENSTFSGATKHLIGAHYADMCGTKERKLPLYQGDIPAEKQQAYLAALVKPLKYIYANERTMVPPAEKPSMPKIKTILPRNGISMPS